MNHTRVALGAVLVAAVFAMPVPAHETDHYTIPPGREVADLGDYLTGWVYETIEQGVAETNRRIARAIELEVGRDRLEHLQSPHTVTMAVAEAFPNAYLVIEGLEHLGHSPDKKALHPGRVVGYKVLWNNVYEFVHLPIDPRQVFRLWQASTIKAFDVYLGTDKVGHFTDMGKNHYLVWHRARERGEGEEEALARALTLGTQHPIYSEAGVLGYLSAGAYSNADLASNYSGFLFYRNLTEPIRLKGEMRPPMLERDGPYWRIADHVSPGSDFFSRFVSDHWDEALTPSHFEWLMRGPVERNIRDRAVNVLWRYRDENGLRRSPRYFEELAVELSTLYGEDYGHKGELDDLITIGDACYDPPKEGVGPHDRTIRGHTPLHWAALTGDAGLAAKELRRGAGVNARVRSDEEYSADWGATALHLAAREGHGRVMDLLLLHGAEVGAADHRGATPLHWAAGRPEAIVRLLDAGADVGATTRRGRTALHWSAVKEDARAIAALLAAGAEPDARDLRGETALHRAAESGGAAAIAALLGGGADPDAKAKLGIAPLHLAAGRRDGGAVGALLVGGADPAVADDFGITALHEASRLGRSVAVEALLRHGAPVRAADAYGTTPLHLACRESREKSARLLIAAGGAIDRPNDLGVSPLHEAAFAGNPNLIRKLLAQGADPNRPDVRGLTPVAIASERGHEAAAAVFREHGEAALAGD